MNYFISETFPPGRPQSGPYKTGRLEGITVREIIQILDLAPNVKDDPDKVDNAWGFLAFEDDTKREMKMHRCGIWDYKGSQYLGEFSTYGNSDVFKFLFGERYVEMYP